MQIAQRTQASAVSRQTRSVAAVSRSARLVVRAETAAAAPAAAEKPKWSVPTLNPDTPSPIFGGSTGGLLRKAQVNYLLHLK